MPDTPPVTPLVDEVAAIIAPHLRVTASPNPDCEDQWRGQDDARRLARKIVAALRPVEADDAGLIERGPVDAIVDRFRERIAKDCFAPSVGEDIGILLDRLASLSAAKVEAEKEVERFKERLLREMQVLLRIADKSPFWNKDASNGALGMAEHLCAVFGIEPAALKGRAQGDGE